MSVQRYAVDSVLVAAENFKAGRISRRAFIQALAAVGALAAIRPGRAFAQADEIVLCNWGGAAIEAFSKAFGEPFTAKSGVKVTVVGDGPAIGAVRAMVDSGQVVWDVTDSGTGDTLTLGGGGYLTAIDYTVVDKTLVPDGLALEFGVANYFFSNVLAYDSSKTGATPPASWADFFDFEKYPGKRTMCKWIQGQLEIALLADGVPMDQLYPLDVDRAFAKLEPHLDQIVFWEGGAQSQQFFRDGEVVMGNIWHTRANLLKKEDPKFTWTWNQGMMTPSTWCVPRGNPAGAKVFDFIRSTQEPEGQISLLRSMGNGPVNPAALPLMTDDDKAVSPTTPENAAVQFMVNAEYYGENEADLQNRFLDFIAA